MKKSSLTPIWSNAAQSIGRFGSMKSWLTLGVAVGLLTATVGCSSQQAPKAEQPQAEQSNSEQSVAQQPADSTAAKPAEEAAGDSSRPLANVQLTAGADPMAMVLATRQPNTDAKGTEQIRLSYPAADKAVVVVTKTGLADDSVAAIRTRYEFAPVAGSAGQWQLTQATEQNKCRANRGPQDWSGELCK